MSRMSNEEAMRRAYLDKLDRRAKARQIPSMVAPEGHRPASPAPSGQGVSGEVDSVAASKARLSIAAVKARNPDNINAEVTVSVGDLVVLIEAHSQQDRLLSAPAPSCAPGEVERNLEAQRQTIEACARVVETSWVITGHMKERVAASVRALRPNEALAARSPQRLDAATVERLPDREDIARVLFDQRQTGHDFDEAADPDAEDAASTLRSICFDDADAVLALVTEPHQHGGTGA